MKKSIKLSALLITILLSLVTLTNCSSGGSSAEDTTGSVAEDTTSSVAEDTASNTTESAEQVGLRVVIVTSPSGVDDGSFNQDNYNGILSFVEKNPSTSVKSIQETDISAAIPAVGNVLADYDVIVTPGFQFADISQFAEENPEKKFILIDTFPNPIDEKEVFDNIYAMTFAEEESGFFAGIAAALETETGKVAVVNGIAYPSNVNYQYGFESGVVYSNKHFGTTAEIIELPSYAGTDVTNANVGGNYIGDFNDESTGKVVGDALINEGCDIIFVAAGASGNGVFTAAKEAGNVKVIGCDVDQFDDGKSGNINVVLTSVLKVMHLGVKRALDSIQNGTFKGSNELLHADTDSTGFVKANGRHQLKPETIEKLDEVYELVKNKTITPASNFSEFTFENFPGLD